MQTSEFQTFLSVCALVLNTHNVYVCVCVCVQLKKSSGSYSYDSALDKEKMQLFFPISVHLILMFLVAATGFPYSCLIPDTSRTMWITTVFTQNTTH